MQSLRKRRACWLGLSEPADSENWFWADGAAGGTKGKWVRYVNWEKGDKTQEDATVTTQVVEDEGERSFQEAHVCQ